MRVLVIEDDAVMAEAVAVGLHREQMAVDVTLDGRAGLARAVDNDYDVIVLDRDLPGVHGDTICEKLIADGCRSRILMLTAAASNDDLVDGLGLGADDYLPKPFDFPVLVARVGALARRAHPATPPVLRQGDLVLDTARRRAYRGERSLELTPKEVRSDGVQPLAEDAETPEVVDSVASPSPDGAPTPQQLQAAQFLLAEVTNSQKHAFLTRSVAALALMSAVSLVLGWLVAGRILRPVRTTAHPGAEGGMAITVTFPGAQLAIVAGLQASTTSTKRGR